MIQDKILGGTTMLTTIVKEQEVEIQMNYLQGFPEPGAYFAYHSIKVDITSYENNQEIEKLKKIFIEKLAHAELQLINEGIRFRYLYPEMEHIYEIHSMYKYIEEVVEEIQEKLKGVEIPYVNRSRYLYIKFLLLTSIVSKLLKFRGTVKIDRKRR